MSNSRLPLTVCMVICNEESVVERALKSFADICSELIVVHDGPCTDRSLDICRYYGALVYERDHVGIAEPHRAWMYGKASFDWVLQVDADEFLSDDLRRALPALLSRDDVACYELVWPNWDGKKYSTYGWPHKKALFRRDKIEFLALPHSEVIPVHGYSVQTEYVLEHRPLYDNVTWNVFKTKWRKWTKVHARYLLKNPSTYEKFPFHATLTTPRYYLVTRHPYLLSLPLGLYQGIMSLKSGGYKAGFRGLKTSFFIGLYYFYLALEVAQLETLIEK